MSIIWDRVYSNRNVYDLHHLGKSSADMYGIVEGTDIGVMLIKHIGYHIQEYIANIKERIDSMVDLVIYMHDESTDVSIACYSKPISKESIFKLDSCSVIYAGSYRMLVGRALSTNISTGALVSILSMRVLFKPINGVDYPVAFAVPTPSTISKRFPNPLKSLDFNSVDTEVLSKLVSNSIQANLKKRTVYGVQELAVKSIATELGYSIRLIVDPEIAGDADIQSLLTPLFTAHSWHRPSRLCLTRQSKMVQNILSELLMAILDNKSFSNSKAIVSYKESRADKRALQVGNLGSNVAKSIKSVTDSAAKAIKCRDANLFVDDILHSAGNTILINFFISVIDNNGKSKTREEIRDELVQQAGTSIDKLSESDIDVVVTQVETNGIAASKDGMIQYLTKVMEQQSMEIARLTKLIEDNFNETNEDSRPSSEEDVFVADDSDKDEPYEEDTDIDVPDLEEANATFQDALDVLKF